MASRISAVPLVQGEVGVVWNAKLDWEQPATPGQLHLTSPKCCQRIKPDTYTDGSHRSGGIYTRSHCQRSLAVNEVHRPWLDLDARPHNAHNPVMYWPLGAPKVYALSKTNLASAIPQLSHDGVERDTQDAGPSASGNEDDEASAAPGETNGTGHVVHGPDSTEVHEILAVKLSRGGSIYTTVTKSTLTVWQTRPTVALAAVVRSAQSIKTYGPNKAVLLRPDALVVVVQTELGYLIHYSITTDPNARVYNVILPSSKRHSRRESTDGYSAYRKTTTTRGDAAPGEGDGIREVVLRFRMVIRVDAGISQALALDDELVVATIRPAALQCIPWMTDNGSSQTSTELLTRIPWVADQSLIIEMVYDRPMNLTCWIAADGKAYAVQRQTLPHDGESNGLFRGFCFRDPGAGEAAAVKVAINARFSLIAIGCADGQIEVYVVKDYIGNIPLSHRVCLPLSTNAPGQMTSLSYSPDGYCLFAGFEKGWALSSVYGKPGASSFTANRAVCLSNNDRWLLGTRDAFWASGGCELAILGMHDDAISFVDIARNAVAGCLSSANASQGLLQSSSAIILYKGHEVSDITAIPPDVSLWQTVQVPATYLANQWPLKVAVTSGDGKYVAVAGRRGLTHFSVASGRWKTFEDPRVESEFAIRGGMCWHQHFLIAAVETESNYQVRVYSREKVLDYSHIVHAEQLSAPAVLIALSGTDSLLVYTYDNTLLHYIIVPSSSAIKLVQVGQIGFHGIIRAPPRVRAISWVLPEDQLEHGDPSQDVATASVLFLVDGKLVLLQPSANEHGELKYDMRVVAQNVEYYNLLREQSSALTSGATDASSMELGDISSTAHLGHSLRDSLWYFDGDSFHVWSEIQDVIACAPAELGRDLPPTVRVPVDFYPISPMIATGIVHGLDADLVQRRDVNFSFFRQATRTQLFLPQLLRQHLSEYNSPAALHLANSYQHLQYFAHALEVLLHDILDSEVDNPPSPPETALLPTAISFLSSFPPHLDIVVNCTRKTELRSWRTLFAHLPPVLQLFEMSLAQGKLQTAAGYLLVMHALNHDDFQAHEYGRLLHRAASEQDWELSRELARFLLGIDSSGHILQAALLEAGLIVPNGISHQAQRDELPLRLSSLNGLGRSGETDYFSLPHSEGH